MTPWSGIHWPTDGRRLVAILIDGTILGIGYYVVVLIVVASTHSGTHKAATHKPVDVAMLLLGLLAITVLSALPASIYYAIMNGSKRGQTAGEMALGIAVRDSRNLGKIGFWRALGRYLIMIPFMLAAYIPYVLDNLAPLWDKRRQAWHDKVAHSVVIDLRP